MKIKRIAIMGIVSVLALAGCGKTEGKKDASAILDESTVGFEVVNGKIDEAQNVPEQDQAAIIEAFEEYIDAFNAQDIDRYIATLSQDPKIFNIEEERNTLTSTFETYDVERLAEDVTIIKYSESEANIFATLKVDLVEKETGAKLSSTGSQVTVMKKEDGAWKVASIYYIGSE